MRSIKLALFALTLLTAASAQANEYKIDNLYGTWCLKTLAATLDGEKTPDNSIYEFTKAGRLNYKMGDFEQSGDYSIKGNEIKTTAMGNYDIISLQSNKMTLKYITYFFFEKGSCN